MKKKRKVGDAFSNEKPRYNYSIKIPPDATPEEIAAFMKEFVTKWNKEKSNEPTSKLEQGES